VAGYAGDARKLRSLLGAFFIETAFHLKSCARV
jgi:hypothetical protein